MLLFFFHFFYLTPPVFDHASSPSCSACLSVFNSQKKGGSEDRGDITSHPHPFLATVGITWEAYRTPPFCLLLLPSFLVCGIKLYKMAIYCKCVANCGCAYTITSSLWLHKVCVCLVCLILCFGLGLTLITTVMVRLLISAGLEETG